MVNNRQVARLRRVLAERLGGRLALLSALFVPAGAQPASVPAHDLSGSSFSTPPRASCWGERYSSSRMIGRSGGLAAARAGPPRQARRTASPTPAHRKRLDINGS